MIGSMAISDLHVESIKQEKAASSMIDSLTGFQINVDIKGELLCQSCTLAWDVNLSFDAHKITGSAPGFSILMTLALSRTSLEPSQDVCTVPSVLSVSSLLITLSTEISVIQFQIIICTSTVALPLWQVTHSN